MLKQITAYGLGSGRGPAAFRRLCVETLIKWCKFENSYQPPSGGCVLKLYIQKEYVDFDDPAAFRRLCVETLNSALLTQGNGASRLQAAVC